MEKAEEVQKINSSLWMYTHYLTGSVLLCVSGEPSSDAATQAGVHSLVESLCGLQGERSKLRGELRLLHSQLEQKERDRHSRIQAFQLQVRRCQTAYAPYLFQGRNNGEACMKSSHSVSSIIHLRQNYCMWPFMKVKWLFWACAIVEINYCRVIIHMLPF